jgi:gluconokinase
MGVSGSGKPTGRQALGERLGWKFEDEDALHPIANIAKMRAGQPLDDRDRALWLGSPSLIAERLAERRWHFMPAGLLESQFAVPPNAGEDPILPPIDRPVAAIVDHIVTALSSPEATIVGASMMVPA